MTCEFNNCILQLHSYACSIHPFQVEMLGSNCQFLEPPTSFWLFHARKNLLGILGKRENVRLGLDARLTLS